ncbi:MAG: CotH kinase family protein [Bacteroidales bacterium]|nr:CotH kinase family protein [Bacteroidales bacterium]
MNRFAFALFALSPLIAGCKDVDIDPQPPTPQAEVSIEINGLDTKSIDLTLSVRTADMKELDGWGIVYCETPDREKGKEKVIPSKPTHVGYQTTITGLEDDTDYYIWGWVEDKQNERTWTSDYTIARTELETVPEKLTGTIIGSQYSVDYDNGNAMSTTVNTKNNVFDGNFDTFFASYDRSRTWVGLDLGEKHVITKVGYSPRKTQGGRVELAVIEGANEPDFSDALPIYMIKSAASEGVMHYGQVDCSRGFRYVRYVSPYDVRCNLAELEFHGYKSEGDDSKLYQLTNLPTVVVNIAGGEEVIEKTKDLISNVYIISENGTNLLATSGTEIRGRGNASWNFEKKPYRLKFDKKQSPLGAPASAKKWTLISNHGDKTLMRNILAFEVSRRVGQPYTPFCHPVDLIINGEYRGCYQLCDQVEADDDRVPVEDGYLIEIDAYAWDEEVMFASATGIPVTIKHPDEEDITDQQRKFINDFFNKFESAALSSNFTDPNNGYRKYLDLDSFLRNFIVGEFCANTDAFWSVYMYKDDADGKLHTGPTWDNDLSFDNDYRTHPIVSYDYLCAVNGSFAGGRLKDIVMRIVKEDPQAKARLVELWEAALNEGNLKDLATYMEDTAELLNESQQLNFKRWKILNQWVHMNYQALGSYEAELGTVRNHINTRLNTLDALIRK